MESKDLLNWLQSQYQVECNDNHELYRRGAFVCTNLVIIGTLLITLWVNIASIAPMTRWVILFLCLAIFSQITAIVFTTCALWPGDWDYPDDGNDNDVPGLLESAAFCSRMPCDDAHAKNHVYPTLAAGYAKSIQRNRERNIDRFWWLKRAMLLLIFSLVIALVPAGFYLTQLTLQSYRVTPPVGTAPTGTQGTNPKSP